MNSWKVGLASLLGSYGVLACSILPAQALDFNFSFTTNSGNPPTVTGVIQGLQEGINEIYTVKINSNPVGIPDGTIFNSEGGSFQVLNGSITSLSNVFASSPGSFFYMNYYKYITENEVLVYQWYENSIDNNWGINWSGSQQTAEFSIASYNFSPVAATAVPFDFNPTEGAALGVPLFLGLGILRKRVARKSVASKAVVAVK